MHVEVKGVGKFFGASQVLKDCTLEIDRGEVVTLLGPSGCGKTTLPRCIAGFYIPEQGGIVLDGRDVTLVPPNKRNVGLIFQNYALFPHLSGWKNVAYGPNVSAGGRGVSGLPIRDARLLTLDPAIGEIARGWLRIEGQRIRDLGSGEAPPPGPEEKVLEGRDRLVMPGLIDCHLHSHEHIHRGRFDNMPMEVWQHFVRPPGGLALGAEGVYLRTMIGILEMVRTGTTCAVDDVNHFPAYDEAEIEAVFRAYEDSGLRAAVSVSMLDRRLVEGIPYVRETFPEALLARIVAQPAPDRARLLEVASEWAGRYADPAQRVRFLVAPSAPSRCSDEFLLDLQALAERLDLPFFTHLIPNRGDAGLGEDALPGVARNEHAVKMCPPDPPNRRVLATTGRPRREVRTLRRDNKRS